MSLSKAKSEAKSKSKAKSKADAARRQNAQRYSTGPRTEEGKARSCQNSLKHGLRAEKLALPSEDPEALKMRHEQWNELFRPQDLLEYTLVQMVFRAALRMDRCARFETAAHASQVRSATNRMTMHTEAEVEDAHQLLQTDAPHARLALRRSAMGCGYLIARWTVLRAQLERDGYFAQDDLDRARKLGAVLAQGQALVGPAPHPDRPAALATAFTEIRENLEELIERERRIREGVEDPDRAESGERELMSADVPRGSLCLRYTNAAHSTFLRAVAKLQQLRKEPLDRSRDGAPYYGPPNEPEAPEPEPQPSGESTTCAEPKAPVAAPSKDLWLAPRSTAYWANETAESLNERLSILAPKESSQVAQDDAGRINDR